MLCLFYPRLAVAVAVEDDTAVISKKFLDHIMDSEIKIVCLFKLISRLFERLSNDGI